MKKGVAFYEALLKFDGSEIMQAIEEEVEVVKQKADSEKERKVQEAQMQILPMIDELLKLRFINQTLA